MTKAQVLIVEDETDEALLIKEMLEMQEYGIAGMVSSGKEAIETTLLTHPDLVLMDIRLEGEIDGLEAARQIHESTDIPIVYLTGFANDSLLKRAKITEPYGYILKPFNERELYTNIEIAIYRHKLEEKLKESEKRYKAVSEMTTDYVYHLSVNDDGQVSVDWITGRFMTKTGYTIKDVRNLDAWKDIIHPDDFPVVMNFIRKVIKGDSKSLEYRIISRNGETLWMRIFGRSEWDGKEEKVIGIIGAVSDITESKRAAAALKEARDKAEAASRAKSEFLANMSHELRTPLNAIIGFSEILKDKPVGEINEKQEKYLNNIHKSGKHLLEMINDIIDLSKAETGRIGFEAGKFSLPLLLNNMITIIKSSVLKKNIDIKLDVEEKLTTIQADEVKLKKIVNILLDNAVKFTPDGGKIKVEAVRIDDKVQISVTDTGIGIKPGDKERIFRGFEQVDGCYGKKYGGTG